MSQTRIDWVKSTPTQAAATAVSVTNAAPGDMMAQVVSLFDVAGAHSGGDEGNMLFRGQFRDWSATPHGALSTDIATQDPSDLTYSAFQPIVLGNRQLHWTTAGPSRLIVFPDLPVIPISVEKSGYNPKPDRANGGAVWKLSKPLPQLLKSRKQPNNISRTDYCLSLNANEYRSMYGPERQFIQVASTPDENTLITNFIRKGVNIGMPTWYINGFSIIDSAVTKGDHTEGFLIPCSVVKTVVYPDTSTDEYETVRITNNNGIIVQAPKEGQFIIEPMTEVDLPKDTSYRIPAGGMYSLQALKIVVDQRLGSGGEVNGIMMYASGNKDARPGDVGYYVGGMGKLMDDRLKHYPYYWRKGIELRDTQYPITVLNPVLTTDKRPLAVLGALNTSYVDHIQLNYNQPKEGLSEVVFDPPPGKNNYVVTVTVGEGEPSPKTCSRPGIERYYQTDTDSEWICSSENKFENHSCILCW